MYNKLIRQQDTGRKLMEEAQEAQRQADETNQTQGGKTTQTGSRTHAGNVKIKQEQIIRIIQDDDNSMYQIQSNIMP